MSHQQRISHRVFVSTVVWEINTRSDTPTLQVTEPLMKLLPDVIRKCNNYAATAPDHIPSLLISGAVPPRWRALSSTKSASRLLAAFFLQTLRQTLMQTLARFSALLVLSPSAHFFFGQKEIVCDLVGNASWWQLLSPFLPVCL